MFAPSCLVVFCGLLMTRLCHVCWPHSGRFWPRFRQRGQWPGPGATRPWISAIDEETLVGYAFLLINSSWLMIIAPSESFFVSLSDVVNTGSPDRTRIGKKGKAWPVARQTKN